MPEITAAMVKELRDRTGAAMMLCKEALTASDGDSEEAIVYIRKKLGAKLTDRGDRVAAEGVVAFALVDDQDAAIIELNSETDFVARNDDFRALARELAHQVAVAKGESVDHILQQTSVLETAMTVQDRINDVFSRLRERIVFRRFAFLSTAENGCVGGYVHVPSNDRIGVLVELAADTQEAAKSDAVKNLARELAMQIAASRPRFLNREDVSEHVLDQERDIARTTAMNEGKPEAALPKIVEGRLRKFYEETVLMDQSYLRDPQKTVAQLLKEAGNGVKIVRYIRYEVGEQESGVATSGAIKETAE